jgi:hypothetical protein
MGGRKKVSMNNTIDHVQEGARFAFVTVTGIPTEYVVKAVGYPVELSHLGTGKLARVSREWLNRPPSSNGSYWEWLDLEHPEPEAVSNGDAPEPEPEQTPEPEQKAEQEPLSTEKEPDQDGERAEQEPEESSTEEDRPEPEPEKKPEPEPQPTLEEKAEEPSSGGDDAA